MVQRPDSTGALQIENLSGATLRFTAKRKLSDTYASAIIKKHSGVDGGIVITDSAAGLAQTLILPADTVALCVDGKREVLFYDLELETALGEVETTEAGQLIIEADVTDDLSPVGPPAAPPDPITPGVFLQYDGTTNVWSTWTLPEEVLAGDVNKVLTVTAAGVVSLQVPSGGLSAPADPADDGKLAVASGGDLVYSTIYDSSPLHWGANGPGTGSGSTNYLVAGGGNTATGVVTAVPGVHVVQDDGTLDILQAHHSNPTGSAVLTYTIEINEVASALTLDLSTGSVQGSNVVNSVAVLRGDRVRCSVLNPGGTNSNMRLDVQCRFRRTAT